MKKINKIVLCTLSLCAVLFASCDPNKEQCWKITLTSPDGGQVVEYYYYGNGVDSDAQLDLLASSMPGFKATKTQTFLSKDNCKK